MARAKRSRSTPTPVSRQRRQRKGESHVPRVVVKFRDHLELPYEEGLERGLDELGLGPGKRFLAAFPGVTITPVFSSVKPDEIRRLVDRAGRLDRDYPASNLLTYFAVRCPPGIEPEEVIKDLLTWPSVETAYLEGRPGPPPAVNAVDDPRSPSQGYLDPAPDGVDAEFPWGAVDPGGAGEAVGFVDCEQGWALNHEDLSAAGITLISGVNKAYFYHGTSVLGEVVAVDNTVGDVGIATHASTRVISEWRTAATYNTADAVLAAAATMAFGDVLLLETQYWGGTNPPWPTEVQDAVFDAIRLASALGVVVVEAAGNGGNDLDPYTDAGGHQILNRASADFRDSGAIMVGAASSVAPHSRLYFSNFGSRIDCYGWGENIDTLTTDGAGTATNLYTSSFGGTSGASPIITGAALIVQSVMEATAGFRMSPRQVRAILADPATGTASATPASDRIGVMPNLQTIVQTVLGVAPDVYVRDYVGDTGDPHSGAISASPDVILLPAAVASPQLAYGQGSGTENNAMLGFEAEKGHTNHIYVRVRNRGGTAANVTATVYWSPVATLVTPDLWTLVGSSTIASVPAGDVLTVLPDIPWPDAAIPAPGHYCFVCLVGNAFDPPPDPAAFTSWANFQMFIRNNNNVTWRNFNVTSPAPSPGVPPGFAALPFLAPGAPDRGRRMALEIVARLPKGARLMLEAPPHWVDALNLHSPYVKFDDKQRSARIPLNPYGRSNLGEMLFPAKSRAKLRLLVRIPKELWQHEYQVFARQLYEGEEVGRVTWVLTDRNRR